MPIPQFLLDRIRTSAMSGEKVADAFANLASAIDRLGGDGAVTLAYVGRGDALSPDDLVPTVTLALRRHGMASPADADITDAEFTVLPAGDKSSGE